MFTGIVQGMATVVAIDEKTAFRTHHVRLPGELLPGLQIGASVAHNGCCLTVTRIDGEVVSFDLMAETLRLSNLGALKVGDAVNVERAAKFGDDIGGHAMSGHVMCTASVSEVITTPDNCTVWISMPQQLMKYVLKKGYIGVDGCSLTIADVRADGFCVCLIPETLQRTLMGVRQAGDLLNIEIDPQTQAIVDTVERVLAARQA